MRITVGKKLGLGFAVVIGMLTISTIVVYQKVVHMERNVNTALDETFPSALACGSLLSYINESAADLDRFLLLAGQSQQANEFKTLRTKAWREIDKHFAKLKSRSEKWVHTAKRDQLADIGNLLLELKDAQQKVENMVQAKNASGNPVSREDIMLTLENEVVSRAHRIRQELHDIRDSREQAADERQQAITADVKAVTTTLIGASLASILIGIVIAVLLSRRIVAGIQAVASGARQIAGGDLTGSELPVGSSDEVGELAAAFNAMRKGLRDLATQISQATDNVNSTAAEMLASTQQQAAAAKEQAATVQEITSTLEEINQSGQQIGERAKQVSMTVEEASAATQRGMNATQETNATMQSIRDQVEEVAENVVSVSERTQTIGDIIATVSEIAEQSNLLALNASIEAVSAGDNGSRFSVVAHEMKNLADRAKDCTVQVRTILGEIQKGINTSVMMTEEAVKRVEVGKQKAIATEGTIREVTETNDGSLRAFQQIIAGTSQQQIGVTQVTQGMQDIRQAIEQTAAGTIQMEKAAANMNALSEQLKNAAAQYRV